MDRRRGTYGLILKLSKDRTIQIGWLGRVHFQSGFYVYVGSALGPGGIRARVARHKRLSKQKYWHIDFFRAHSKLIEVWYSHGRKRREHEWARCLARMKGSSIPVAGFGSSDCDCFSHLIRFERRPSLSSFERSLRAFDRHHPGLRYEGYSSKA